MNDDHKFKPGQIANPAGRPIGSRNRFSETFVDDVAKAWAARGPSVLEIMAMEEPAKFAQLCVQLVPKNVAVTLDQTPRGLDAHDLAILRAIRDEMPLPDDCTPEEVLTYTREALRAHRAKTVEAVSESDSGRNPQGGDVSAVPEE